LARSVAMGAVAVHEAGSERCAMQKHFIYYSWVIAMLSLIS
jgi:hypothetical protein